MAKKNLKKKKKKFNPYFWMLGIALGIFALNLVIGVIKKPAHLLKPVSSYFYKLPSQTWSSYESIFTSYEKDAIDATFLAALAQAESAGNPIATPYWQLNISQDILSLFQPASSSVGIYQITTPTFKDAKRFCFVNGQVVVDSSSDNLKSCWLNHFRFRFSVNDSVHLTSARLHYYSNAALAKYQKAASVKQQQKLAAIIHLCGPRKGDEFVRKNFSIKSLGKCGSHSVRAYLNRVFKYKKTFMAMR